MPKTTTTKNKAAEAPPKPKAVTATPKGIKIDVFAKPGARQTGVTEISDRVHIQIAAPPQDGEANTELIKYLSKLLKVSKSDVVLEQGHKSRDKVILITDSTVTDEAIMERLRLGL